MFTQYLRPHRSGEFEREDMTAQPVGADRPQCCRVPEGRNMIAHSASYGSGRAARSQPAPWGRKTVAHGARRWEIWTAAAKLPLLLASLLAACCGAMKFREQARGGESGSFAAALQSFASVPLGLRGASHRWSRHTSSPSRKRVARRELWREKARRHAMICQPRRGGIM